MDPLKTSRAQETRTQAQLLRNQILHAPAPTTLREWSRQAIFLGFKEGQRQNVWLSARSYIQWLDSLPTR